MNLATFDNTSGEGIVSFQPWQIRGPEYEKDNSRWYCHLLIDGKRIFEYGCPCGTCGIVFRKVGSTAHRLSDAEAVQLLGALNTVPANQVLQRLATPLESGIYHPIVIEGAVRLIETGTSDDYFATDVVRLFGLEPPDYENPSGPETPYYKFGSDYELERTSRRTGPHKALITAVLMPLHDWSQLDRERIEFWKQQYGAGVKLTAFAVSVVDNQSPAMDPPDTTYKYKEHFLFTNCLLDGHHRIQAAAEIGAPVRLLSLVRSEYSLVSNDDLTTVLSKFVPDKDKLQFFLNLFGHH